MAYSYGSIDSQVQNLEQQLALAKQRQTLEQQRQAQVPQFNSNIPMQQNVPQMPNVTQPIVVQPQSNVEWIVIKTFDEAQKIVLGGYNEKWFRVDGTMTVGMKFVENGFEQIEYYNLISTNPFAKEEEIVAQPQVDLTGYVKADDVNRAVGTLQDEIETLKKKIIELENKGVTTSKPTTNNRKVVSDNGK